MHDQGNYMCKNVHEDSSKTWEQIFEIEKHNILGEDAAGNAATTVTTEDVTYDPTIPVITRLGSSPIDVEQDSTYNDAGATASDNVDGTITGSIVTVNPVNTATLGEYTVTYNVSDAAGNDATEVTRTVNVVDTTAPIFSAVGPATLTSNNDADTVDYTLDEAVTGATGEITFTVDGSSPLPLQVHS